MSIFELFSKNLPPELSVMLNRPLQEAIALAKKLGMAVRLTEVDGEPYSIHSAPCKDRVNFKVANGMVVEVGVG